MFKPALEPSKVIPTELSSSNIATPMAIPDDTNSISIILYDKQSQPYTVIKVPKSSNEIINILYNDKLYTFINSIYIETDVYRPIEQ